MVLMLLLIAIILAIPLIGSVIDSPRFDRAVLDSIKREKIRGLIYTFGFFTYISCDYKPPPVIVPIKPYIVIDKNGGATDYTIVCVDANGMRFTFDTNFMNEDKYQVGDTIK